MLLFFVYVKYKKYAIMGEEGDVMAYSRVKKYQELRDGLKDEAGIKREKVVENVEINEEDDDFLSFIKKDEQPKEKPVDLEDTLTEAKTFEQMRQEGSKELEQALRSAKKGVGKESQFNTRMDILSKIREPEKVTIKIDAVDEYKTDEFARGMFLNENKEENDEPANETVEKSKKKMTLMEKLVSISPEEDAKKAQEFLQEEAKEEVEADKIQETIEIEEEIELKASNQAVEDEQKETASDEIETYTVLHEENNDKDEKRDSKIVKVLDVIITILVMMLIILLAVIIYQNFF